MARCRRAPDCPRPCGGTAPWQDAASTARSVSASTARAVADTGEWTSTYIDMAGRTLATMAAGESKASPRRTDFFYESAGTRLIATVDPDGVITLFGFDGRGRRTVQCVDVNRNGSIDYAGRDRITLTRYSTEMTAGTGFRVVTTEVYAQDDSGVPVVTRVEKTAVHGPVERQHRS